jgi:hypothetical protein
LQGKDLELVKAIWKKTEQKVNPRHFYGHWLFAYPLTFNTVATLFYC